MDSGDGFAYTLYKNVQHLPAEKNFDGLRSSDPFRTAVSCQTVRCAGTWWEPCAWRPTNDEKKGGHFRTMKLKVSLGAKFGDDDSGTGTSRVKRCQGFTKIIPQCKTQLFSPQGLQCQHYTSEDKASSCCED